MHGTARSSLGSLAAIVLLLCVLASSYASPEPGSGDLLDRIAAMRRSGEYQSALALARELVLVRAADDSAAHERSDAARLVATLERIVAMPADARDELALADSLTVVEETFWNEGLYEQAAEVAGRQADIRRRLLGDGHPDLAESLNNRALDLRELGRDAEAEPLLREALAIRRASLGPEHPRLADSIDGVAAVFWARGDYGRAEELFQESLAMRRSLLGNVHPDVALGLNNLATLLAETGDYRRAESLFRESLAIRRELLGEDHPDLAVSLCNLGTFLSGLGRLEEGEELHREALAIRLRVLGEEHPLTAESLNGLALIQRERGDLEDAEGLLRRALAIQRHFWDGDHWAIAQSLNNLGTVKMFLGDLAAAEPLLRESLAMKRRLYGENNVQVAEGLSNLTVLLDERGDHESAEGYIRESIRIYRAILGPESPDVAVALNNLACLLSARGDLGAAEELIREVLASLQSAYDGPNWRIVTALRNLGDFLRRQGEYAESEARLRESLHMEEDLYGSETLATALTLSILADLSLSRGDLEGAEALHRDALALRKNLTGDRSEIAGMSLSRLGHVLWKRGEIARAESLFVEAARIYERSRIRARGRELPTIDQPFPYEWLAALELELGNEDTAWQFAERALGQSLGDIFLASATREMTSVEVVREDSLARALSIAERQLEAYLEAARTDTTGVAADRVALARADLLSAEAEWGRFQNGMAARAPVSMGQALPFNEVRSALPPEAAIIGWLDGSGSPGGRSWCYAIAHRGDVHWFEMSPPSGETGFQAETLRRLAADPASPRSAVAHVARALWRERMAPLAEVLASVRELIVIPSGGMGGVPVETLVDEEGATLGERFTVSYTPSATMYARLAQGSSPENERIGLFVGDPPFSQEQAVAMMAEAQVELAALEPEPSADLLRTALSGNKRALSALPRLAGSRLEAIELARLFDETLSLLALDATEQRLVRLAETDSLSRYGVIHLATHALIDDENPDRSALVLSQVGLPDRLSAAIDGTRIYDGVVTAGEIAREWSLDADLVTLSACETGLGREVRGDGYVGLAHALLQVGARSLLVSLWKVDDQATRLLMRRFYENCRGVPAGEGGERGEMSKAEALQEAKRWLREYRDDRGDHPYEHPYYWSSFVLIGDRS